MLPSRQRVSRRTHVADLPQLTLALVIQHNARMATAHPIGQWLQENNLSQRQLAIKAGIPPSTVSRVLGGKRRHFSVEAAEALKRITGLSLDAILVPAKKGGRR